MKIVVFGAGGVGGYFGARLSQAGADVHLIARGTHLDAIRERGLRIRSPNGNIEVELPASDRPEEIGRTEVVLFCVKSTDTEAAAARLGPLLGESTAVVSLQNGIDNEAKIARLVGASHVVGGVAYIMATITEPGVITHQGGLARIVLGEMDGSRSDRLEQFLELCRKSRIDAEITENIQTELWRKFAVICATAGMTAAVRLPLGEIRASPAAFEMYRKMVEEVVAVATAEGVSLPQGVVSRTVETARELPPDWYSSLHYDMTHDKPMELDALHGTVLRIARERSVAVPMCEAVYAILEPWALRNDPGRR